jgi:hypothetical protein
MASLACPLCLCSAEVEWKLECDGYDPSVECLCPRCDERWSVYMTPYQTLRFGLLSVSAK